MLKQNKNGFEFWIRMGFKVVKKCLVQSILKETGKLKLWKKQFSKKGIGSRLSYIL